MDELDSAVWRKSTYSGGASGNCVEVAFAPSGCTVGIRDSKSRTSGALIVGRDAWRAFLAAMVDRARAR